MKIKHTALFLITALSLLALPAYAQDKEEKAPEAPAAATAPEETADAPEQKKLKPLDYPVAFRYQPEYCEFTAAFPEEPIINEVCEEEGNPDSCFKAVSYTKVFDMATTVSVKVICNPATTEMYEYFTPKIMETTVRKMTQESVLETYNVNTTENEGYRLTGLVGQGQKGLDKTLFIAQLWLSEKAIMSVEAEISGHQLDAADELFAGLLNNIGYAKNLNPQEEEEEPKAKE